MSSLDTKPKMSPPPPDLPPSPRPKPQEQNWLRQPRDRDNLIYGALIAILLHLIVFALFPTSIVVPVIKEDPPRQLEITLEIPEEELPPDPPEFEIIRSNPEAPDEIPTEPTELVSDRNQTAANTAEPETLSLDQTPANEGEEDTDRIVQGNPYEPTEASNLKADEIDQEVREAQPGAQESAEQAEQQPSEQPQQQEPSEADATEQAQAQEQPAPQEQETPQAAPQPSRAQPEVPQMAAQPEQPPIPPRPGWEPDEVFNNEGPNVVRIEESPPRLEVPENPNLPPSQATNPQQQPSAQQPSPRAQQPSPRAQPQTAQQEPQPAQNAQQATPSTAPEPRPRVSVTRDRTLGPLRQSDEGVMRRSHVAFNTKYSQFGEYWAQVEEAFYLRWIDLLRNSRSSELANRASVTVTFSIDRNGEIVDLKIHEESSGSMLQKIFVEDAIQSPAPYRKWTPEMILLGEETLEMTVTFRYF
ncbi:MAG: hypothetical protein Q7P63_11010 [Verrucomicrobiota bacterium JB022]|nr:hypothetical protein [Verrucomicrobiota bacterium JB022]